MSTRLCGVVTAGVLIASAAAGADWPGFRGPRGDGVSADRGLPLKWSADENLVWKTKLPGPGTSSPVVCGDRVFLTCFTGYGGPGFRDGDLDKLRRHLLCVDGKSGKVLWTQDVVPLMPENEWNNYLTQHVYASSTPATDGERVYVFFGRTGVLAYDLDGKKLWQTEVGKALNSWGSAGGLVVYKDLVIVNASVESTSLIALDRMTGKQVWKYKGVADCWSTPLLLEVPGGKTEVVVNTLGLVLGFDPEKGEELWRCDGITVTASTSSPTVGRGVVYVMGAGSGGNVTMAIRAGGRGDVTKTHVLWKAKTGANHCSPILVGDYLYYVSGQVWCLRADTGQIVHQERLYRSNQEYVSPVAADGKLFAFTRRNGTFVLRATEKPEKLAHNELGDASDFNASPAVAGGRFFVRSNEYLYCLGEKK